MRVLLVAPRSNLLEVEAEIEDVMRSGLTVDPLIGNVTRTALLRRMREHDYDVLWLATHGSADGVQLSDGILSASALVQQVRDRFTLVVLNSCSSLSIAQLLQEEANTGVICTLIDVPDVQAYQTGSRLSSALAESSTVVEAYLASKPGGNRSYLYLPALSASQDSIDTLIAALNELKAEMVKDRVGAAKDRRLARWLITVSVALHPVTWLVWYAVGRLG